MYDFPAVLGEMSLTTDDVPALADAIERLYAANVWALDRQLGGVLDAIDELGLRDESVVAVTADHGEVLYRPHDVFHWTHSGSLAPEVLEVPLVIRAPGVPPGRYTGVTRSIDVYPTLAGLAGVEIPARAGVQGVDLSDVLFGESPPPALTAYSQTGALAKPVVERMRQPGAERKFGERMKRFPSGDFRHAQAALRRGDLVVKLTSDDGETFEIVAFDRAKDPYEAVDVFDPGDPMHAEAARDLRAYKARLEESVRARRGADRKDGPTDADAEDALRVLRYIE